MLQNIKFNYLYRDAGNYKSWGKVIYANPDALPLNEIEKRLRQAFDQETYFIADQIGLAEMFFEGFTDDDHCYHEFCSVESTEKDTTDSLRRTIKSFVEQVESESLHGWHAFDTTVRYSTDIISFLKEMPRIEFI